MNACLLDTHAWIWWAQSPERLRADTHELIAAPDSLIYLSAVSTAEISIKHSLDKLGLSEPPDQFIPASLARDRFLPLPLSHAHALRLAHLPWHHRDPFDRLLIAQAQVESLPIVTDDPRFPAYGVTVIRAS